MKYVEFYKLQNDGSQDVIATCKLAGDKVVCEGDEVFTNNLEREGVFDYSNPQARLFPKDGLKFLEQLKHNFKSGYLNASDIKEE